LFFVTSLFGPAAEIDQYVHEYYSLARFNAIYDENVPAIEGKHERGIIDPGFVLHPHHREEHRKGQRRLE
jgi:hypothetical protein